MQETKHSVSIDEYHGWVDNAIVECKAFRDLLLSKNLKISKNESAIIRCNFGNFHSSNTREELQKNVIKESAHIKMTMVKNKYRQRDDVDKLYRDLMKTHYDNGGFC